MRVKCDRDVCAQMCDMTTLNIEASVHDLYFDKFEF